MLLNIYNFILNKLQCTFTVVDINECENPEHHSCYGVCQNLLGSYKCQCQNGTNGDPWTKGGCDVKGSSTGTSNVKGSSVGNKTYLLLLLKNGNGYFILFFEVKFIQILIKFVEKYTNIIM